MNEISDGHPAGSQGASHSVTGVATARAEQQPGQPLAVPGFDSIARMVSATLSVPLVVLALVDGGTLSFSPGGRTVPALPMELQRRLRAAAERVEAQVDADMEASAPASRALPTSSAPLRFFASMPVRTPAGHHVGALCVMDSQPRRALREPDREALADAATLAGAGVALRADTYQADPVTQLPQRRAFFADLRACAADGADGIAIVAIEMAPVDRFNAFVRAMGHSYVDTLTRLFGQRVREWMSANMRLYKVAATRFVVLLPDAALLHDAPACEELVALLRQPFDCRGIPLSVQPGVGLLEVAAAELDTGDALRQVMCAAHAAHASVRGWALYQREQDERYRHEFFLLIELSAALHDPASMTATELSLHYQPRVDVRSGRCVAVEALARWHHPGLGDVPPARFVPLVEHAGLMHALTDWVLLTAFDQLARWRRDGLQIRLSINVSSADVETDLVARLRDAAQRFAIPLDQVELEITETTFSRQPATMRLRLEQLRELGVAIAIDDFGTGYSNLTCMRELQAHALKIDQSFVRGLKTNPDDAIIVRSIAAMARKLGFRVVAEGVETDAILDAVRQMECDEVQGFAVGRPMPAAELTAWLAGRDARTSPAGA